MTTVNDILKFLESLAPQSAKMEWDNVGLLCGRQMQPVQKILVALDPFQHVCEEAKEIGADLLVTHHPLIFRPIKSVTDCNDTGKSLLFLMSNGIAVINAHTNLDVYPGGVNDCLAAQLGLKNVEVISPEGYTETGEPWGLLRKGTVNKQSLEEFLPAVKNALQCPGLRYVDGGKPVEVVAVGGGSCGSELYQAAKAGCDTFITADIKYNQFWDAKSAGINLIDAGHFYTENPVCQYLADKLQSAFPDVTTVVSEKHTDCAKFFL